MEEKKEEERTRRRQRERERQRKRKARAKHKISKKEKVPSKKRYKKKTKIFGRQKACGAGRAPAWKGLERLGKRNARHGESTCWAHCLQLLEECCLGPPARCPFSPFLFCLGGSPIKIDYRKRVPTGGPSWPTSHIALCVIQSDLHVVVGKEVWGGGRGVVFSSIA